VLEVDIARKRIVLSIKQTETLPIHNKGKKLKPGFQPGKIEHGAIKMNDALDLLKQKFVK
jgi:ribosomal protein S1